MNNIILISFILCSSLSYAKIINVPADIDSIQGGINLAANGDTVLVQPGTYVENIKFYRKDIVVGSLFLTTGDTSYISQTVIDGNKNGSVVSFLYSSYSTTKLSGFTVMNGFSDGFNGGGIQIEQSNPTVTHMQIINNIGGNGGGIKFENTTARFDHIIVKSNSTKEGVGMLGGGIYFVNDANPILTNVVVENNFAYGSGGGIYIQGNSHPLLSNCYITRNTAKKSGGGIFIAAVSKSAILNCNIKENTSENNGGGIYCENAKPILKELNIEKNIAENAGGGIYFEYSNPSLGAELGRLSVIGNKAKQGGGIYFENCTKPMFSEAKCNIYLNFALEIGNDLYSKNTSTVVIYLDTFSVANPTDIHAYPLKHFSLNINHAKIEQVAADLYVSPDGHDFQNGLSSSKPLKTLNMAFAKILADSTKFRNIFLDDGSYDTKIMNNSFFLSNYKYVNIAVGWQAQMNIIGDKIIVYTPWWKTIWAYFSYLFLSLLFIIAVWRFQTNRLKIKHELELEHVHAEKLEEIDRLKSRFFANISHEFRTPLTLIKGPVKQMLSGEFAGNVKEQYRMILRNSDRLLQLINQLLDLSKLESGKMKLQVSIIDIIPFLKGLVFSFASLAERKKITLKFSGKQKSLIGYIDCDKMEKIISNLLSNAFKFTPEGGVVEVDLSTEPTPKSPPRRGLNEFPSREGLGVGESMLQITVTNTGRGIPTDCTDKIFDRFYQADDNYKKDSEGTGIGLALTKELVEVCHGEISVECKVIGENGAGEYPPNSLSKGDSSISTLTKGNFKTVFTIWLPIAKESFKEDEIIDEMETGDRTLETEKQMPPRAETIVVQSESSWQSPVSHLRPARQLVRSPLILIVEDNPDVVQYISNFLEKDYRLISAENGSIGLKKALDNYPDLIISDVMMPEMDGFELCKKLKTDERLSHIPVILLTAKADLDSKINGLKFGADDYVIKPFEAREIQVRVKNLIEQRNKLREKFTRMIDINPAEIAATSTDEQFVKRLLDIFENHVTESDFSTEDFAREIGISRSNLHRKLQALTNQPTHEFLRSLRLKRAAQLLKKSAASVTEVAYAVGFNNPSHFSKIFREQFGQSPSEFANKNQ